MAKFEKMNEDFGTELLHYGEIVFDYREEEENSRYRLIEYNGFIYYHKMKDGEMDYCFKLIEE